MNNFETRKIEYFKRLDKAEKLKDEARDCLKRFEIEYKTSLNNKLISKIKRKLTMRWFRRVDKFCNIFEEKIEFDLL